MGREGSKTRARIESLTINHVCYCFLVSGPVEYDPEYQLIVESNNMVVEIDNEICKKLTIS